jgi:hypothetical protein
MALARINPALSNLAQRFPFEPDMPLPHAEEIRASPTKTQYAIARATVAQNITTASPYGESILPGFKGVVATSKQSISWLKGSTARIRVVSVVSARLLPKGMDADKPYWPAGIGQYD